MITNRTDTSDQLTSRSKRHALALARTAPKARLHLLVGGAIYLALWLYGMIIDHDSGANFVPVNTADNWLHLPLGVGMIALGTLLARKRDAIRTAR
ncbi:DUF4383 domain-containing protein [Streptomyces lavendulocolor]|uniref:DUF4383 domain-containing protein n=1 Tax=Streptomyces lavendulocolor TaxID=67316 RepID=UPI00340840C9